MSTPTSPVPHQNVPPRAPSRPRLQLIGRDEDPTSRDGDESELLDFDDDADVLAGIIPVPPRVSPAVRENLEFAFLRFEDLYELSDWVHTPNHALGGATPYERLLDGDGLDVLRAALRPHQWLRRAQRSAASQREAKAPIRLVL